MINKITIVKLGHGGVSVSAGLNKHKAYVGFSKVQEKQEIGSNTLPENKDTGDKVILEFSNKESINVVMKALAQAKKELKRADKPQIYKYALTWDEVE